MPARVLSLLRNRLCGHVIINPEVKKQHGQWSESLQTLHLLVGQRHNCRTFLLIDFGSYRDRDLFRYLVSDLIDEALLDKNTFCIVSTLGKGHQGELLLVLPEGDKSEAEERIGFIRGRTARQLSLRLDRVDMSAAEYDACSHSVDEEIRRGKAPYN